jgi:hypothetical protein
VHHTPIDSTGSWDGAAVEKAFDKRKGDFPKLYAWVDEGESDSSADGTDKEDGWGPHHDVSDTGVPGAANTKGYQAAMAALNGAHGGKTVIPAGDRQAVWDHLAAHYKDGGTKAADIPDLEANSVALWGQCRLCHGHRFLLLRPKPEKRDTDAVAALLSDGDVTVEAGSAGPGTTIVCPSCAGTGSVPIDENGVPILLPAAEDGDPASIVGDNPHSPPLDPAATGDQVGAYPYDAADDDLGSADETALNAGEASDLAVSGSNPAEDYMPMGAMSKEYPTENLIRARRSDAGCPAVLLRDTVAPVDGQGGSTMFGYFSTFDSPYEIDSLWEGHFIETVAPGAFKKTIKNDATGMRVLYDHGFDPQLGNKPLGPIQTLREDANGAYYEVPLLDTDYNRNFLLPCLRGQLMNGEQVGSQLGASFRFIVTGETWDRSGKKSRTNPNGLDQRTITEAQVLEFGPVTFPAAPTATAGVRSGSDDFINKLRTDPLALARFTERTSYKVVERLLDSAPVTPDTDPTANTDEAPVDDRAARVKQLRRRARVALLD